MGAHFNLQQVQARQRSPRPSDRADAVRYAVLQRMAPVIRHDMVANLQPIGMICELMEHSVAGSPSDVLVLKDTTCKMSFFAKAALTVCVDTVTWLERDAEATITVAEAVDQSAAMLGRAFGLGGFRLINQVGDSDTRLARDAIRHTLSSALLAAIDTAEGPSDVLLRSELRDQELLLWLEVSPRQTSQRTRQPFEEVCRHLNWDDVQAVADAEDVGCARHASGVTLSLPAR